MTRSTMMGERVKRGLDAQGLEDGFEDDSGSVFLGGVDVDDHDDAGAFEGGGDFDFVVGCLPIGEGDDSPALGGDGGFFDDVTLSIEDGFGGGHDGFDGVTRWEFGAEEPESVGGVDGG